MKLISPTLRRIAAAVLLLSSTTAVFAQSFITSGNNIITSGFTPSTSRVGFGFTTAPASMFETQGEGAVQQGRWRNFYFNSANTEGPLMAFVRGRGTVAVPASVQQNDVLGRFDASAYTSGALANVTSPAAFTFIVDGPVSLGVVPTRMQFLTGSSSATRLPRMDISSAGVVRIRNLAGTGSRMVVTDASGNLTADVIPAASKWTAVGNNVYNTLGGNVGIGNTNPLFKLTVNTTDASGVGALGLVHIGAGDVGVATGAFNSSFGWIGTTSNSPLGFGTGLSTSQMYLGTNGNFGIGTDVNPAYKLTVQSTGDGLVQTDGTTRMGTFVAGGYGWVGTHTASPLYLGTGYDTYNGMRVGVNPSANGTITFSGTDDTRSKITSIGKVGLTSAMFRDSTAGGGGFSIVNGKNFFSNSPWSGLATNAYWTNSGFKSINKGYASFIGTTSNDGKLSFYMYSNAAAADQSVSGSERMSLSNSGDLSVTGAVSAGSTLAVATNATVGGTLAVTSNATVGGTFAVTGNTTAGGTLAVTGNTTVGGTLAVTGNTTLTGETIANNRITSTYNSSIYNGGYNSGQVNLIENEDDYARLTFSSTINSGSWHLASYLGVANSDDRFNIYNNILGNVLTCSGTNGNVGIGVLNPVNKLEVCGTVRANEVLVQTGWCDFVFSPDYDLRPLSEVKTFIQENKHLPDVTKGDIIEKDGLLVGNGMQQQIRKIEELTLYAIEQDETLKAAKQKLTAQDATLQQMNTLLMQMNSRLDALETENKALKSQK